MMTKFFDIDRYWSSFIVYDFNKDFDPNQILWFTFLPLSLKLIQNNIPWTLSSFTIPLGL